MDLRALSQSMMLFENRDSIIDVLDQLLSKISVAADLIGGVALQYYDYRRNTEDIDILISQENYEKLADAIVAAGGTSLGKNNRFELNQYQIQLCYAGQTVRGTTFPEPSSGKPGLNVVSLKLLLKMKLDAGMDRAKDRADFIELVKRNKISRDYILNELSPILPKMQQQLAYVLWDKASKEPP